MRKLTTLFIIVLVLLVAGTALAQDSAISGTCHQGGVTVEFKLNGDDWLVGCRMHHQEDGDWPSFLAQDGQGLEEVREIQVQEFSLGIGQFSQKDEADISNGLSVVTSGGSDCWAKVLIPNDDLAYQVDVWSTRSSCQVPDHPVSQQDSSTEITMDGMNLTITVGS